MSVSVSASDIIHTLIVGALVLIPIIVLIAVVAIALCCSEFWAIRRFRIRRRKRTLPDLETPTDSKDVTESENSSISVPVKEESESGCSRTRYYPLLRPGCLLEIMDCLTPSPLRVAPGRRGIKYGIGPASDSLLSYPLIPRRRSSLRVTSSTCSHSSGSGVSEWTPSLDGSQNGLHISKKRPAQAPNKTSTPLPSGTHSFCRDEPDEPKLESRNNVNARGRIFSGFLRAMYSGSWSSKSDSSFPYMGDTFCSETNSRTPLTVEKGETATIQQYGTFDCARGHDATHSSSILEKAPNRPALRHAPIAYATLDVTTDRPLTGTNSAALTVTIDVSINVEDGEVFSHSEPDWVLALDVVIILDTCSQLSSISPAHSCMICWIIISNLVYGYDRFAIGYLNGNSEGDLELLLPLSGHCLESVHDALCIYQAHYTNIDETSEPDPRKAICRAANILRQSSGTASPQIFLVTDSSKSYVRCSLPSLDENIGLHTISPDLRFELDLSETPVGWHIYFDHSNLDLKQLEITMTDFIRKVVVDSRSRTDHGHATDLKLRLFPGKDCQLHSISGIPELARLRPGEAWSLNVQIIVPAVSVDGDAARFGSTKSEGYMQAVKDLMVQLESMLADFSREEISQPILTVELEYKHSLLPKHHKIHLESCFSVSRLLPRSEAPEYG